MVSADLSESIDLHYPFVWTVRSTYMYMYGGIRIVTTLCVYAYYIL